MKKPISLKLSALAVAICLSSVSAGAAQAVSPALLEQAQVELRAGKVSEKTLNELQTAVQAEPGNSKAHLTLGLVLDQLGLTDPAAEQFELAVKYGANDANALVILCKEEIKAGRIQPAIALLNEGLKKFPGNAEMLYMVGDYLFHQKSVGDARVVLERAYMTDPNLFGVATSLGNAILETNPIRAAQLASRDLAKKPDYELGHYVRGFAYKAMGRHSEAAADLQAVFDKQPMLPNVCEALAQCYYWLGDYDKALKPAVFLSASTAFNNAEQSGSMPQLTRVLLKIPRATLLEKMAKIDADLIMRGYVRPEFYYTLGKAYDQIDMPNAAMQAYKRCTNLEPDNARAYYRLALDQELYLRDYNLALENYQRAYNLRPWDQEVTVAYMRLQDRKHNRNADIAWKWKDWLYKTFNLN
jgi:tetratricopeptide (TPR) repeat protein